MAIVTRHPNGKVSVNKSAAFCELLSGRFPEANQSFRGILDFMDSAIQNEYDVSDSALSNCHGDWYEWLIGLSAWKFLSQNARFYIPLLLPNVVQFDVAQLYCEEMAELVYDLRRKVRASASVNLITSNPDFVIVDNSRVNIPIPIAGSISEFSEDELATLGNAYELFKGKCQFDTIRGFMSVKVSLRPDRRLQIPHEGSLMKAIYTHLQTRQWIIDPPGLKYYAVAGNLSKADKEAMQTVATHSITTVSSKPQAAVDAVFQVDNVLDANRMFSQILHPVRTPI